jgi:hypothetical protein
MESFHPLEFLIWKMIKNALKALQHLIWESFVISSEGHQIEISLNSLIARQRHDVVGVIIDEFEVLLKLVEALFDRLRWWS